MTQKHYTKQEMKEFWHDIFNPKGEDLIDVNASGLMCQYLIQIEEELDNQSMTQRQLSIKSGVSYNTISECFNLNRLMNFRTLAKIELALGIEFELKQLKKKGGSMRRERKSNKSDWTALEIIFYLFIGVVIGTVLQAFNLI